ncbi:MAG: DUF2510 domain-containing protein [Microbacteriaceae bacterium]|nr:DUF2510 domain-containing protein [Microbacteriaceae bacterium]
MSTPAGWYPDPAGSPQQRWWDGAQWTEQLAAPQQAPSYAQSPYLQPQLAPAGTSPQTAWIWILTLLPILGVIPLFFWDLSGLLSRMIAASGSDGTASAAAAIALFADPAYLTLVGLGLVSTVLTIVFAYVDWKGLRERGVPQPLHWAWIFFIFVVSDLIYIIGRDVVAKRRTGRWSGAAWVAIVIRVAVFIIAIVYVFGQLGPLLADIAPSVY